MTPLLSMSIPSLAGIAGKPGIRIMFPKIGIRNPAPAAISNSRMVILKPEGRPVNF